jgi:hypothetical protein
LTFISTFTQGSIVKFLADLVVTTKKGAGSGMCGLPHRPLRSCRAYLYGTFPESLGVNFDKNHRAMSFAQRLHFSGGHGHTSAIARAKASSAFAVHTPSPS